MEHCGCDGRKKVRSEEEKKNLVNRINRIAGQMNGVKRMIEEDRYCDDVLTQLAAIEKSVRSLSTAILERHMHSCLVENVQNGNLDVIDEIVELFKRFQ